MSQSIQCNCGAVEITLDGEPLDQFYCHCRDCRASSGGAYSLAAVYPDTAVRVVRGTLATSVIRTMSRHHCAACGTQMTAEPGPDGWRQGRQAGSRVIHTGLSHSFRLGASARRR